jgi:hypothetical protein
MKELMKIQILPLKQSFLYRKHLMDNKEQNQNWKILKRYKKRMKILIIPI